MLTAQCLVVPLLRTESSADTLTPLKLVPDLLLLGRPVSWRATGAVQGPLFVRLNHAQYSVPACRLAPFEEKYALTEQMGLLDGAYHYGYLSS